MPVFEMLDDNLHENNLYICQIISNICNLIDHHDEHEEQIKLPVSEKLANDVWEYFSNLLFICISSDPTQPLPTSLIPTVLKCIGDLIYASDEEFISVIFSADLYGSILELVTFANTFTGQKSEMNGVGDQEEIEQMFTIVIWLLMNMYYEEQKYDTEALKKIGKNFSCVCFYL